MELVSVVFCDGSGIQNVFSCVAACVKKGMTFWRPTLIRYSCTC